MKAIWNVGAAMALAMGCTLVVAPSGAQTPDPAVQRAAAAQKQPLLDSLKEFVSIETGSRDLEGITRATELLATKLRELGGQVEFVDPPEATIYRMADTPPKVGRIVRSTFSGTGKARSS